MVGEAMSVTEQVFKENKIKTGEQNMLKQERKMMQESFPASEQQNMQGLLISRNSGFNREVYWNGYGNFHVVFLHHFEQFFGLFVISTSK